MSDCILLGDRGYLSDSIQIDLFQSANIKLEPSQRRIDKVNPKKNQSNEL